jgi:DNA repair exonuclease SbcCD ATPase subunit
MAVAWLLLGQTPRRETERFTRAVSAMRTESTALESVLTIVAARLEENHSKLRNEAAKLMSLGDEASDRLGRVAHYLSKESGNLDKKSAALEAAAESARVDIGVLLADLPKAEEQARAVAQAMKDAGLTAHEQAGTLEAQLSSLAGRAREADEQVGGAAQRLGAHLARVESTTAAAAARMDQAAATMTSAVDDTMARAAEALDTTRSSIDAQGAAVLASIEQNRAAFEHAGEEAARSLAERLETIGGKVESLPGSSPRRMRPATRSSTSSPSALASSTGALPSSATTARRARAC